MKRNELKLGLYEKALPAVLSWPERLAAARRLGFDFVEMSIDETDARMARLDWTREERKSFRDAVLDSGLTVPSVCLSAHRRFPLGSRDPAVRERAAEIMRKAIRFAVDTGVRTLQLAGYDVYYEEGGEDTRAFFLQGLRDSVEFASRENVMLSMEIMDHPLLNSIVKFLNYGKWIPSPWFTVYPDVGNLSAWGNDVAGELELGLDRIVAIHLKDTVAVTPSFPGKFKEVPFGSGCVDFTGVFRKLAALRYRGPFLIEMWTEKSPDPEAEIRNAKDWLMDRMREAAYLDRDHQGA
ncbi:MAG: xylulose 5-phosphate 3-epimerase [Treponema sp. GWB1_62_6]|nr:MAG: xylulose 5-phosphate 3-epimerase [Treponema sp. GWC1_61_84]OHE65460.1 MAG: xylulose 5-phosphate 3-epimerase [Treponema sp. GWB1_62_6]OHE74327.1 MAG: xylulose 5-phosphate 3-epimerase [Treponema sp. RIFOXYC1_FULL_61_9]HCM28997.1 xylulose 5-phosphate 3-epimerase [Treponema sp.]